MLYVCILSQDDSLALVIVMGRKLISTWIADEVVANTDGFHTTMTYNRIG